MRFCLTLFILATATIASANDKLNVVLIVLDDYGYHDVGCYGSSYYRTPNIDRLAKEGMRFTHGYAACPVCSPTRAAIMTGRYPARLHLTDWLPGRGDRPDQKLARPTINQFLPGDELTIAELLNKAGYTTGNIGKWHLGGEGHGPTTQGFDVNIAGDEKGSPRSYFAPYTQNGVPIPGLENAPKGEYLTDRLGEEAVKFIEANKAKPFFLYLPHFAVHIPLKAKAETIAKYDGELQPGKQSNPIYAAMIESSDDAVGAVLKALDDNGLTANTLVIFTSDNGGLATREGANTPATYNGPLRAGKGFLYEGGIRVPYIVRWPGVVKPGTVNDTPISSVDLFPTIAEACGQPVPENLDGVSLVSLLKGKSELAERNLFWHYPHYANQGGMPGGVIRQGDMKLIEFYEDGRRELFNVVNDPGETKNLAGEQTELVAELARKLDDWRNSVDAQMMTPNPKYVPNPQEKSGRVVLPAKWATIEGTQLRYEPLPHKNTLGYWTNPSDTAEWTFTLKKPGTYTVEALIGCGTGSGGSTVAFESAEQTLTYQVKETGGFQQFVPVTVGTLTLDKPGRYTLTVSCLEKGKGNAVMDLRQVVLRPAK